MPTSPETLPALQHCFSPHRCRDVFSSYSFFLLIFSLFLVWDKCTDICMAPRIVLFEPRMIRPRFSGQSIFVPFWVTDLL